PLEERPRRGAATRERRAGEPTLPHDREPAAQEREIDPIEAVDPSRLRVVEQLAKVSEIGPHGVLGKASLRAKVGVEIRQSGLQTHPLRCSDGRGHGGSVSRVTTFHKGFTALLRDPLERMSDSSILPTVIWRLARRTSPAGRTKESGAHGHAAPALP